MPFYRDWTKGAEPRLSRELTIERLRAAVKYVFVIFQENELFDNYFGTFPGANGIYSDGRQPRAPKDTPGFAQKYKSFATGELVAVEPFLVPMKTPMPSTASIIAILAWRESFTFPATSP